jgi:hypothetical protein
MLPHESWSTTAMAAKTIVEDGLVRWWFVSVLVVLDEPFFK